MMPKRQTMRRWYPQMDSDDHKSIRFCPTTFLVHCQVATITMPSAIPSIVASIPYIYSYCIQSAVKVGRLFNLQPSTCSPLSFSQPFNLCLSLDLPTLSLSWHFTLGGLLTLFHLPTPTILPAFPPFTVFHSIFLSPFISWPITMYLHLKYYLLPLHSYSVAPIPTLDLLPSICIYITTSSYPIHTREEFNQKVWQNPLRERYCPKNKLWLHQH